MYSQLATELENISFSNAAFILASFALPKAICGLGDDSFNAFTDGQMGDYEDWKENGGTLDDF